MADRIEFLCEAGSEDALRRLIAEIGAIAATADPEATSEVGPVERTEGAFRDIFTGSLWVTVAAPILTGAVVLAIEKHYTSAEAPGCVVITDSNGLTIRTPEGEIFVVDPRRAVSAAPDTSLRPKSRP